VVFYFIKLEVGHINVCREKGSLLSFVYIFGWVAHQCCWLPPK
jgi:hypothetical protein